MSACLENLQAAQTQKRYLAAVKAGSAVGAPAAGPKMPAPAEASYQDTEGSIDEEIASLEQVIQDAHAKILKLRARRNARVPFIARLPTENLSHIFILFEQQHRQGSLTTTQRHAKPKTGPFGWIAITHVCHHWRSVARALPHLWSHVPMSRNAEPIKMFLTLSNVVPLSIIPGTQASEDELPPEILSLLISEVSRIRSLRLSLPTAVLRNFSSEAWDAPLLESISLDPDDDGMLLYRAPAFILGASLPVLRSLSLTAFPCSFSRGFLRPTITSLFIRHATTVLSIAEWVDMLDGLPLLERLVLQHAVSQGPDELVLGPAARRVEMAHLAYIELHEREYVMQCPRLLDHLVLPACRTLALTGTRSNITTAEECRHIFLAVASALGDGFAPRACELRLHYKSVAVRLWPDTLPVFKYDGLYGSNEDGDPSGNPQITVKIDCFGTPIHPDILPILVSALPLGDIRTLSFWHANTNYSIRSLSALQKVETFLYLCQRPTEALQALSESQRGTLLLFPALRYLTLRDSEWHPSGDTHARSDSHVPLSEHIDGMLLTRGEMDAPLHELHLQGLRNIDRAEGLGWLDSGQKDVSHFQWDTDDWGAEHWWQL